MDSEQCYGVYHRTSDGIWLYPWGDPVPGARDVTVRDLLRLGLVHDDSDLTMGHLTDSLCDDELVGRDTVADGVDWEAEEGLDRIVGLYAPELHVRAMLTMGDIADMIDVEPDTVAAYRYRGYLPEPQAVIGRTPVWSRPIVRHWLQTRPGNGWRTDIYGDREEYMESLQHRRAARRRQRQEDQAPLTA